MLHVSLLSLSQLSQRHPADEVAAEVSNASIQILCALNRSPIRRNRWLTKIFGSYVHLTTRSRRFCAETQAAARFPAAVFIGGDAGLTDIEARAKNPMSLGTDVVTLHLLRRFAEEGPMSRSEKSIAFQTGMIIAALYVILLLGFSRESYMRRDAMTLEAMSQAAAVRMPKLHRVSPRSCQGGRVDCEERLAETAEASSCTAPFDAQQETGGAALSLTVRDLRQVFGEAR